MEINCSDGINYEIDIIWRGDQVAMHWMFKGKYADTEGGILYTGDKIVEIYNKDGNAEKKFVYTDGNGVIRIGKYHFLCWDDYKENIGENSLFEKVEFYGKETNFKTEDEKLGVDENKIIGKYVDKNGSSLTICKKMMII